MNPLLAFRRIKLYRCVERIHLYTMRINFQQPSVFPSVENEKFFQTVSRLFAYFESLCTHSESDTCISESDNRSNITIDRLRNSMFCQYCRMRSLTKHPYLCRSKNCPQETTIAIWRAGPTSSFSRIEKCLRLSRKVHVTGTCNCRCNSGNYNPFWLHNGVRRTNYFRNRPLALSQRQNPFSLL